MMCVLCGEPESMCTCPAEVTIFAQAHLVGRDGNNAIINGETLRVLIERAQAWGKLKSTAVLSAVPEGREQEAKDAARYRWLRTYEPDLIILPQYVGHPLADGVREYASSAAELDAALDAAILLQRAPQEGSGNG